MLGAGDASACDCALRSLVVPNETTAHVPSNTRVWASSGNCIPVLKDKLGQQVEVNRSSLQIGIDTIWVLQPVSTLIEGESYRVEGCEDTPSGFAPRTFTVTEGADTTPPPVPGVAIGEFHSSDESDCGKEDYADLSVTGEGDLFVLDVDGKATLDEKAVSGRLVDLFDDRSRAYVGRRPCDSNWSFGNGSSALGVRLGAYDLAGNFSGFNAPQTVKDGSSDGCALARPGAPGRAGAALFGLLPMLAWWGRRRVRQSTEVRARS